MTHAIRRALSNHEQLRLAGFSPLLSHLLFHRGILDASEAQKFLEPDYDRDMHDPFLLKDAEKAADRIIRAIGDGERIAIYADYDADGLPGSVVFHDFFNRIGFKNFSVYIPHRHDEGFGVNIEAVEQLAGEGVKLIITIDCGIADVGAVARARELGLDVIITDHHEPPVGGLPPAFAIVDHKQADCAYPDKNLCGSGVAYKLIQAILKKNRFDLKDGHEKWFLDMVGIATLSDMVPLMGENRVFAHYGLTVLRQTPRKGLRRLLDKLKISRSHITEDDISFMITPRINAASRMGVPMDAFNLLATDNDDDARTYADHLDKINTERKGAVASLVKEVKKVVRERHGASVPSVIVLGNPSWRPALLGLVANSCVSEFNRPVFLWGRDGDNAIKGSCRSEGLTHMVELMRAVPNGVFTQFGGHRHSGGFAVGNESIHYLEQRLNEALSRVAPIATGGHDPVAKGEDKSVDLDLPLDAVNWQTYNDIAKLAPFGTGNPKPIFLFRNVVPSAVRRFGKGSEHIELVFSKSNSEKISAISFFGAECDWAKTVRADKPLDLVASLDKSMYRGRTELRLRVSDIFSD